MHSNDESEKKWYTNSSSSSPMHTNIIEREWHNPNISSAPIHYSLLKNVIFMKSGLFIPFKFSISVRKKRKSLACVTSLFFPIHNITHMEWKIFFLPFSDWCYTVCFLPYSFHSRLLYKGHKFSCDYITVGGFRERDFHETTQCMQMIGGKCCRNAF